MNSPSSHTHSVEVKLLKDDEWKRIQQNTFTRWVNQHLKEASGSPKIENLATDFHDGILLIQLAEVLAQRNLVRFNRKPTMRTQKLDNISTVLNFFQKEEHIKIVNIDSSHIADHNLKLILGLVWTLILHYSLSQPIASAESVIGSGEFVVGNGTNSQHPSPRKSASSTASEQQHQQSPKKRLLAWIQERVPHLPVTNFTSDWTNGIVLGALVDACLGSDAFAEWRKWTDDGNDALLYTHRAMQAAEDGLGVAKLITPEELTNPNVDEKSVMTYLSQFPRARPLLLTGLGRHEDEEYSNDTSPPAVITDMETQQQMDHPIDNECDSNGITEPKTIVIDVVHLTHRHEELQYEPLDVLPEEETVALDGAAVARPQPGVRLLCRERSTDHIEAAAMVAVEGHGLQDFVPGQSAKFMVDASKTGFACPKALFVGVVTSRGPADRVMVDHVGSGRYEVAYTVQEDVDALVFVKYGKNNVDGSPFSVRPMRFSNDSGDAFTAEMGANDSNYYRM